MRAAASLLLGLLAVGACGSVGAGGDAGEAADAGADGAADAEADATAGADASWPGGNPYTGASCPCSFGHACVDDACVPAETLFVSVADGLGFANRSCVFPAPAFAEEYVPMGRVGRCELLGGAEAVGSDEGHGAITLTGASPSPTTWDARAGCGVPPLVSFVDGATMTVDVAAHGRFPAASATLMTPGPLEGVLLPTSIVLGEPLALGWIQGPEGAAGQIEVVLLTREPTRRIRCVDVPDTGAFRVPAEATAALVDATRVGVSIVRSAREHLTPPGSGVSIEIALVRATVADIPVAVPTP